jgi:hypothetical protein
MLLLELFKIAPENEQLFSKHFQPSPIAAETVRVCQ